jgi:fatty acid desaturase
MKNMTSMRIRVSRFLSERYRQRERPGFFADFALWGVIVAAAVVWTWVPLVRAMETLK